MTLRELISYIGEHPFYMWFFFLAIPLTAWLAGMFGRGEGHLSPWKYLYSTLVYLCCIPGIFALALSIYLFLFERRSIFDTDLYTQILPMLVMFVTLMIIRRNVSFDALPGFDKLSGLVTMIAATIFIMWIVDKTHIVVFSYLPFGYLLLIFAAILLVIRFGWSQLFSGSSSRT